MNYRDAEFKELLESIKHVYGYDFTGYAEASLKRRINQYMTLKKVDDIQQLEKLILQDENMFEAFIQNVSVTVTEMFRDPLFYKSLRDKLIKRLATYPFIKIWIAGCATGEEVYSVAIMLKEENLLHRSLIYATDINQRSLQVAKDGMYPVDNMKSYIVNYQKAGGSQSFSEYYKAKYNSVLFDKSLKQNVVFSAHNLVADKSFNEFQLIICRNVLIYFNQQLQNRVIGLFYDSLCPLGALALGNKESLLYADKKKCFEELDARQKIFIKIK